MTTHLPEAAVAELFRSQHGVISRGQAMAAGLTERQVDYRVTRRDWVRLYPGVYRHSAVEPNWPGDLLAAVIHTGGLASHRCAAALWDLDLYNEPPIEVTVAKGVRTTHDVRLHQTTQPHLTNARVLRGIPTTGIERTLIDCAAVVSFARLERLCEAAIRKNLTSWDSLVECLRLHSKQGRNGCGPMRRLLEARLGDGTIPLSDFSRLVVQLLVDNGIRKPEVEFRITDQLGDLILQVDLAWPGVKKAWELDGLAFHFGRTEIERDKRKRNRAKTIGWSIQEILWSMYIDDPAHLVKMAREFLAA